MCTIQTFPFALEEVRRLAATQGKRFAVIADEAHSSQSGEAASKLKAVLTASTLERSNPSKALVQRRAQLGVRVGQINDEVAAIKDKLGRVERALILNA